MPNLGFKVKTFLRWISQNCAFYIVQLQIIYLTSSVSATASQSLSDSWLSCIFLYDFSVLYWQLTYWLAACLLFFVILNNMLHFIVFTFFIVLLLLQLPSYTLVFGLNCVSIQLLMHSVSPQSSIRMWIAVNFGSHLSELTNYWKILFVNKKCATCSPMLSWVECLLFVCVLRACCCMVRRGLARHCWRVPSPITLSVRSSVSQAPSLYRSSSAKDRVWSESCLLWLGQLWFEI